MAVSFHLIRPPLNESSIAVFNERTLLAGAEVSTVLYGMWRGYFSAIKFTTYSWLRRNTSLNLPPVCIFALDPA